MESAGFSELPEKRGPIEKGPRGWPVNPLGVVALVIFTIIFIFFIVRPLFWQKSQTLVNPQDHLASGRIVTPQAGEIVKKDKLTVELSANDPGKVAKVQFWAKTYADGRWQMIGEVTSPPYKLDWQIPPDFQNKAIAVTSHIYNKDGKMIKDPGGWKEGIIILSP